MIFSGFLIALHITFINNNIPITNTPSAFPFLFQFFLVESF